MVDKLHLKKNTMNKKDFTKLINTLVDKRVKQRIEEDYIPIFSKILAEEINTVKQAINEIAVRKNSRTSAVDSIIGEGVGRQAYNNAQSEFGEPSTMGGTSFSSTQAQDFSRVTPGTGAGIDTIQSKEFGTLQVPDSLKNIINKDYSGLMKKVDAKKGRAVGG